MLIVQNLQQIMSVFVLKKALHGFCKMLWIQERYEKFLINECQEIIIILSIFFLSATTALKVNVYIPQNCLYFLTMFRKIIHQAISSQN